MNILAVKTHAFGDALMATPAVKALIDSGHRVTAVAGPSSLPVWGRLPGLRRVISSPAPCGALKLLRWTLRNRQSGYHRAIHFGSSTGARNWVRLLSRCGVVSGSDSRTGYGLVKPAAADFCRIAGVECPDLRPVFPVSAGERDFVRNLTGETPYVVMAPGGGRNPREFVPWKRWPMEGWSAVSLFLKNLGFRVFLTGGTDDLRDISGVPGTCLAGKLTWGQTAALVSGAAIFTGNDSGPAHLAVSAGTPALVLFGPTDPDALYPPGSIVPVRSSSTCAPCYSNSVFQGCRGNGGCMSSITKEEVIENIRGIL